MSITSLCKLFGKSKQAYYKRNQVLPATDYDYVRQRVVAYRSRLPKLGGRKLYHLLSKDLQQKGIKMGRDKFFAFLRKERLLVAQKQKYHKTTNSKHWMRKYPNKIRDLRISRPEQVWVADITYLLCEGQHCYLHLLTDAYSKKIVGFELADNLKAETTLKALRMAIRNRKYTEPLIHHSDRGLQYCSQPYIGMLIDNQIDISMTEQYDPYENAVAERINGILKMEFGLDTDFENWKCINLQVNQAIQSYNQIRPHLSLNYMTPNQAHTQSEIKLKTWKRKTYIRQTNIGL